SQGHGSDRLSWLAEPGGVGSYDIPTISPGVRNCWLYQQDDMKCRQEGKMG
ncbi:MAG: hypothetical protein EZS28_042908, partial [Streblomastix strix]